MPFPENMEAGNLQIANNGMAHSAGGFNQLVLMRFQQLGADSASMWSIAMTTPTMSSAMGMRVATESGSGRTRVESNTPASTQVVGPTT